MIIILSFKYITILLAYNIVIFIKLRIKITINLVNKPNLGANL